MLVKVCRWGLPLAHMGAQSAPAQGQAADMPEGFGVAVVREDGKWRCSAMRNAALNSLTAAETELRELRSAGAVFGLLDVDDEFFVIVRPAPAGTRLLLSDATAALDYDIAAEVLEKLDNDISPEELEDADPFEEGDLGLLADVGLERDVAQRLDVVAEALSFEELALELRPLVLGEPVERQAERLRSGWRRCGHRPLAEGRHRRRRRTGRRPSRHILPLLQRGHRRRPRHLALQHPHGREARHHPVVRRAGVHPARHRGARFRERRILRRHCRSGAGAGVQLRPVLFPPGARLPYGAVMVEPGPAAGLR